MGFDRTAAQAYLRRMFGRHSGYVAVANKTAGPGKAHWAEHIFMWPQDSDRILEWAEAGYGGNLFICPALRREKGRHKGDGAHLQWLWADVDMQAIHERHHDLIRQRIERIATYAYASGSGDNRHVYIKLTKVVPLELWRRLNQGLRDYLMADAKYTDNALLRLPGTRNYKPGGGRVLLIGADEVHGVVRRPEQLLKLKAWRDVVVTDDVSVADGTWQTVDVEDLRRGSVKAMTNMDIDEGVGRYGTRHGAVYRVTQWLSKRGFNSDQIHSLMATFKPGLSKEGEERGYDMHADIAKCLASHPTREAAVQGLAETAAITAEIDELEEADDPTPEELLSAKVLKLVEQRDASRLADQFIAQRNFQAPPEDVTVSFADVATIERPPVVFAVDKLAVTGQNITITGQYKAGKTMLAANLIRSFCDHTPFLGEFKTRALGSAETVGFWSLEMTDGDLYDGYLIPQGIEHPEKLAILNGRGYGVSLLTDVGRAWAINWLKSQHASVWILDSWARICRMGGVDENDNGAVSQLCHRLDEIKLEAGVSELFLLAHTGRLVQEEGKERARGATFFDDWSDSRWLFTRDGATRFLAVDNGRGGVDAMDATSLTFDEKTKHMTLGAHNKTGARVASLTQLAIQLITEAPGMYSERALIAKMRESAGEGQKGQLMIKEGIREAVENGFVRVVPGPRSAKMYEPTPLRSVDGGAVSYVLDGAAADRGRSGRGGGKMRRGNQ